MKLSLIICSRSSHLSNDLEDNIKDTIGVDYELVVVDNSNSDYTIFTAYNEGVRRSTGDMYCFMHDDIMFYTKGWGKILQSEFQESDTGLIGVAGGHYFPDCPASWWSTEYRSGQLIQGAKKQGIYTERQDVWHDYRMDGQSTIEVAGVDGLFFCISADLFDDIRFDDVVYHGFHCYDADICMQIHQLGKKVKVSFEILIKHSSIGNMNYDFFETKQIWYDKWKDMLPIVKGITISDTEMRGRQTLVEDMNDVTKLYYQASQIRYSSAYRLGKMLLKPFVLLKSILK